MLRRLKSLALPLVQASLYWSGIAWLTLRLRLRRRATVLMYHRVLPAPASADAYSSESIIVSAANFERHMRLLRRHFNPVSVAELDDMLAGRAPWKPRAVLVTFDDGWFDNAEYAAPILEKHRIPAVVFVATGYVGTPHTFWQERLTRLLHLARRHPEAQTLLTGIGAGDLSALDEGQARSRVRSLVSAWKERPRREIDVTLATLESQLAARGALPADNGDDRFMSWEQVAGLERGGLITVGSHAHSHAPLPTLPGTELGTDLARARELLDARLGHEPRYFAYPNGDHDAASVEAVRRAGHALAFVTRTGRVQAGDAPLTLRRINVGDRGTETTPGFMCRALCWM